MTRRISKTFVSKQGNTLLSQVENVRMILLNDPNVRQILLNQRFVLDNNLIDQLSIRFRSDPNGFFNIFDQIVTNANPATLEQLRINAPILYDIILRYKNGESPSSILSRLFTQNSTAGLFDNLVGVRTLQANPYQIIANRPAGSLTGLSGIVLTQQKYEVDLLPPPI